MRTLIFVFVFIAPPFLKKHLLKWFCGAHIGRGAHIGWFSSVMAQQIELGDYSEIRSLSIIKCEGEVKIGAYSVVSSMVLVYGASSFILGEKCYVGPQCLINADRDVRLGHVSALGPRSMIFTHGSFLPYTEGYWVKLDGVTIGDYVWMAAGVFVHPGVRVGDHVFVNSRSVITQDIPEGAVVAGNPAQRLTAVDKIKRKMKPARVDRAAVQILEHFSETVLRKRLRIRVSFDNKVTTFRYHGRGYILASIPANGRTPLNGELVSNKRCILLVNRADWLPPQELKNAFIFDLTTRRTKQANDKIHAELWRFMRMYFGVTFEFREKTEQVQSA